MAAVHPSRTIHSNIGSLPLTIYIFTADVDDSDTFATSHVGVINWWCNATDGRRFYGNENIDVSHSAGTFTFHSGEDTRHCILSVLSTV